MLQFRSTLAPAASHHLTKAATTTQPLLQFKPLNSTIVSIRNCSCNIYCSFEDFHSSIISAIGRNFKNHGKSTDYSVLKSDSPFHGKPLWSPQILEACNFLLSYITSNFPSGVIMFILFLL